MYQVLRKCLCCASGLSYLSGCNECIRKDHMNWYSHGGARGQLLRGVWLTVFDNGLSACTLLSQGLHHSGPVNQSIMILSLPRLLQGQRLARA
jgi:hypothetical protein